jgi:hypothetical protein
MTIDLEDQKAKVIRAMMDIDAGIPKAVRDWTELCSRTIEDRRIALFLMIDGARPTDRMEAPTLIIGCQNIAPLLSGEPCTG